MAEFWVRPNVSDVGLLDETVKLGFTQDGLIANANEVAYSSKFNMTIQNIREKTKCKLLIDPNTERCIRPDYIIKASYKQLSYVADHVPDSKEMLEKASEFTQNVINHQLNYNPSSIISPYILITEYDLPGNIRFNVQLKYYHLFKNLQTSFNINLPYFAICLTIQALSVPEISSTYIEILKNVKATKVYFVLYDFEEPCHNPIYDSALNNFLTQLKAIGVEEILFSHGPFWVYLLFPKGITGFATGINWHATQRREYLRHPSQPPRHNFYIPYRFTKVEPEGLEILYDEEIIKPCACPICNESIIYEVSEIRKHYLFARSMEVQEIKNSSSPVALLKQWLDDTEEFIKAVTNAEVHLLQLPNPSGWKQFLES